jgi:hypothetical protein
MAAGLVLALAACGSKPPVAPRRDAEETHAPTESARHSSGEKQRVAQVLEDYETEAHKNDPALCDLVTWDSNRQKQRRCTDPIKRGAKGFSRSPSYEITVKRVGIVTGPASADDRKHGIDAAAEASFIEHSGKTTRHRTATLIRVYGRWLIAYLGRD